MSNLPGCLPPTLRRLAFERKSGAAATAVLVTALLGAGLCGFSIKGLEFYGWGMFVGVPVFCGFAATGIYSIPAPRRWGEALAVTTLAVLFLGLLILCFALDGLICLLMAFPLAWVLAVAGMSLALGLAAYSRQRGKATITATLSLCVAVVLVPLMGLEPRAGSSTPASVVTTSVEIDAARLWSGVMYRLFPSCPRRRKPFSRPASPTRWPPAWMVRASAPVGVACSPRE